jgi:hypothetical protein
VFTTAPNDDHKFVLDRVIRPSGRYTFRVWFGGSVVGGAAQPREEIVEQVEHLGGLLEWSSRNLLAVDAADETSAKVIAGFLQAREDLQHLTYETGRTR